MIESGQEFSGKTVEDAIEDGLNALGVSQDDVEITVVSKGSRGILGFGSEPALVRLTLRSITADSGGAQEPEMIETAAAIESDDLLSASPKIENAAEAAEAGTVAEEIVAQEAVEVDVIEPAKATVEVEAAEDAAVTDAVVDADVVDADAVDADAVDADAVDADISDEDEVDEIDDEGLEVMASDLLAHLIRLMDFEAEIDASWQGPDETTGSPYLLLDIRGDNLGALIGRRGETLSSIQYLLRLMVNQQVRQWKNIVVDVEHYKERRVAQLSQLGERMARQVAETGRSVTLEPMPGNERRIIHMTLRDNPDVFTESTGEGERRKVNIFPQR